jgi:hypothetical protein
VFVRCGKWLVVLALVLTTGLHWAALQTVAWTTMLAANLSSQQSLTEAVSETFDGKHLCPLCRAIAAAKKSEKKSEAVPANLKLEFPPAMKNLVLVAPTQFQPLPQVNIFAESLAHPPLTPPPRATFV